MADNQSIPTNGELSTILAEVDSSLAALEAEMRPLAGRKKRLLRQKLRRLDEILSQREKIAAQLTALENLYPDEANQENQSAGGKPYENMAGWEAAREVLRKVGHAMRTGEIAQRVVAGGKELAEPVSSKLSSMMSQREDIFFSDIDRHKKTWGLREWEGHSGERTGD